MKQTGKHEPVMTLPEIHPDMLALLKAMDAKWLNSAPENGFWHQPGCAASAVIGWLDLTQQAEISNAFEEIFAGFSGVNRIVTFASENNFPKMNQSGIILHAGEEFIYAVKQLKNEGEDFYGIRFYDQIRNVEAVEYAINVADDFTVDLKKEPFFSALNGSGFIVAYEEGSTVCGTMFVHGVTESRCWIRRLFLQPRSRGKGVPKNMMKAALLLAENRGFQAASILVARKIWDKGWLDSVGFVPEKTVRHITVLKAI